MAHKWDIKKRSADALEEHHFQAVCTHSGTGAACAASSGLPMPPTETIPIKPFNAASIFAASPPKPRSVGRPARDGPQIQIP